MKKGVKVPAVYKIIHEKLKLKSDIDNIMPLSRFHHILAYNGISKCHWKDVVGELLEYKIIERHNQHYIKVVGPKKSVFWNNSC